MRFRLPAPLLALALLAGCATTTLPQAPAVSDYVYRLGAADKIKVTVFGSPTVSGEYSVDGEGIVSLPLVGNVQAKGMTLSAFRAVVEGRLASSFMRNPQVSAEVINFRPIYILGEVTKPGQYAFGERITVYALAAMAGGFTYRANRNAIYIRHEDEATETRYSLNSGTAVQPGDTVRVGERVF